MYTTELMLLADDCRGEGNYMECHGLTLIPSH